jgi:hypothetical protein
LTCFRKWHGVPQDGLYSNIDKKMDAEGENRMPKMRKGIAKLSNP